MQIQILNNIPRIPVRKRLGRSLIKLLGYLLTISGFIFLVPLVLMAMFIFSSGKMDLNEEVMMEIIICLAVVFICIPLGARLRRGKRQLVLYLRKFGFEPSTKALTYAICKATGRRWRLVTLDDTQTKPVSVSKWKKILSSLLKWIFLILVVISIWYYGDWILGDVQVEVDQDNINRLVEQNKSRGMNEVSARISAMFGYAISSSLAHVLQLIVIFILVSILVTGTLVSWSTSWSIKKAERSKRFDILNRDQISKQIKKINRRTKQIFSPRLIVAHVGDSIWQEVIEAIDAVTDHVIIDISKPTKNLLWEVKTIQKQLKNNIIYIGNIQQLSFLKEEKNGSEINEALKLLLDGSTVLSYADDRKGMKEFAKSLHALLEKSKLKPL